ncbi:MAG: sigma-70 family RNA polymerase sigma factor [Ruminococcus sp.]|nr:sigma-70 family RNA polymerase sigma factor [Ruminococcus sp.]
MTDIELIRYIKTDPDKGLRELIERYSGYVYTISYSKLSGVCRKEDIEETVSDIFMMFYKYISTTDKSITKISPYLSVIAKRHSISRYREFVSKTETVPLDDTAVDPASEPNSATDRERLIDAIKSLGEPDSEIFIRKYFMGQRSRDIASALDMKTNTVDKIVSRGLVKLRRIIKEED